MLHPRLGFRLLVASSLFVGVAALQGGWLRAAAGLCVAVALGWVARQRRDAARDEVAPPPKSPRRTIGAGVATALLGLAWWIGGAGWEGAATLLLGVMVAAEGARLSLELVPLPAEPRVASSGRASLAAAVAADESLRLFWDAGSRITPKGAPAVLAERIRAAAARSRERGWLDDPSRAHPPPPALEKPDVERAALRGLPPALAVSFESEFEPFDADVRDAYLAVAANRRARALLFRRGEPRPALVCIHGYGGGRPALDARAFDVAGLQRRLGIDVLLYTLPLHGRRAPGRRSGERFLDFDPRWTDAALAQAVFELRRLVGWLQSEGAPAVGVQGMSLGGYTTALLASLEGRLACAVPQIPAASLSRLVWSELGEARRAALEAHGASWALLDEAWASHAPLRHRPRVPASGRMIVAGLADRITPASEAQALWEHWGRPPIAWFPGTHLVPLGRAPARAAVEAHLRRTLLQAAPAEPVALSRFRLARPASG